MDPKSDSFGNTESTETRNITVSQLQKEEVDIEANCRRRIQTLETELYTRIIEVCQLQKEKDDIEANCRRRIQTLETELDKRNITVSQLQKEKDDIEANCRKRIQTLETDLDKSDQSEHWTIVEHYPMNVDNSEQAEYKHEYVHSKVSQLQKEKDDIEANCRKRIQTLETGLDKRNIKVRQLQKEKDDIEANREHIIQTLETYIKNSKKEISILHSQKEDLKTRLMKEEKKTSDYFLYIEHQNKAIETISSTEKRLQRDIEQYMNDMAILIREKMQLKNQLLSMEKKCELQKETIESLEIQNKSLNATLVLGRIKWGGREHQMHYKFNLETDNLKESLMNAVQEKDDHTMRLSNLASDSLTHNIPNIADLSDPNRPTKLAEAFSELYDNEWADAFEKLKDDDEVKTVKHLLTMLQKAYGLSVNLSEHASVDTKGPSTKIVFSIKKHQAARMHAGFVSGASSSEQSNDSDASSVHSLDDKTRTSPIENCESKITFQTTTGNVNTIEIHDTENKMTASQQNLLNQETHYDTLSGKHQDDGLKNDAHHTTRPLSAMDEKLLVHGNHKFLELGVCSSGMDNVKKVESETDIATVTFDFEKLQPTEKQLIGDIRKRVLNDIKGQIISMISHAVVVEMNKHDCENSIFTYVKACASICWEMRIHQPPVCLEFVEVDDQTPLNSATYKHYTKSGLRMDYVVWPALYLYKGGPLLSKGVAQGK